jgi:hypothetical protein
MTVVPCIAIFHSKGIDRLALSMHQSAADACRPLTMMKYRFRK